MEFFFTFIIQALLLQVSSSSRPLSRQNSYKPRDTVSRLKSYLQSHNINYHHHNIKNIQSILADYPVKNVMGFLKEDLMDLQNNWISKSSRLISIIPILEYAAIHEGQYGSLNETIYARILKMNHFEELQKALNYASSKVTSQFFYNAFKTRNRKALKLLENVSNVQINLLFQEIMKSWNQNAKLKAFKSFTDYITQEKLKSLFKNGLSSAVLVNLYPYAAISNSKLLKGYSELQSEQMMDVLEQGLLVWDRETVLHFSKDVIMRWDDLELDFKIKFVFQMLRYDPQFLRFSNV